MERLRAAKEQAKEATQGRCGDALAAASAVSGGRLGGASLGGRLRPKAEETRLDRLCRGCPALSYRQRLAGVACCMLAGTLLSLLSLLSFTQLMLGNPLPFALKYSLCPVLYPKGRASRGAYPLRAIAHDVPSFHPAQVQPGQPALPRLHRLPRRADPPG